MTPGTASAGPIVAITERNRMTATGALHSVLGSAGPQAAAIEGLWWLMLWTTAVVTAITFAFIAAAIIRGVRRNSADESDGRPITSAVSAAVTCTVLILFGLLVVSVRVGRAVTAPHDGATAVPIVVTAHQWWWEITYENSTPSQRVVLANEIHIPVGRPIAITVESRDVIHSFWVPNLLGKRDLIPGYHTAVWLQADRPGIFRGQCAEFCGRQHANMLFHVIAESDGDFEAWLNGQRAQAPEPSTADTRQGKDIFMASRCSACHTIRGTDAAGAVGPDLTHVGGRIAVGAGILPNTREHMAAWIAHPQAPKPGNEMPENPFDASQLAALAAYMESLQ
jgi:cytochrome c oxidase subunit 2